MRPKIVGARATDKSLLSPGLFLSFFVLSFFLARSDNENRWLIFP